MTGTATLLRRLLLVIAVTNVLVIPSWGQERTWPLFAPGEIPPGKMMTDSEAATLRAVNDRNEARYLVGHFVVTASGANRAVLRTGGQQGEFRIVVEYPPGISPPPEFATVARGNGNPLLITDIRVGADGQVTIYAREIIRAPIRATLNP